MAVPRLIHLNGPPGIGKSTLAQRYADEHPGALNLDIDQVRALIGGWRHRFAETGELARPIAFAMTRTHLASGHDVVLPQYLGRVSEIERFEAAAHDSGAVFCEIVLMDSKARSIERFASRGRDDALPWHRQVQDIVEANGGAELLADMHDALTEVLGARPDAVVVASKAGELEQAYGAVLAVLARAS